MALFKSLFKDFEQALNVTIREVQKDTISLLPYAREDVFGLVCLFSQERTPVDESNMQRFTQAMVADAIKLGLGGPFTALYRNATFKGLSPDERMVES